MTDSRWIGPYLVEKELPSNYLVRKIGTSKTQVPHRTRMSLFTSRQPPANLRITPQEYKPDPDVSRKHDDLYARAWECDYEQPIFDAENDNATPLNSAEIPVQSDSSIAEIWNTPGTANESSPEKFSQMEELSDVTDTYPDVKPDVEASSEQPNSSPTNPRKSKYNLRHNRKTNCN